MSVTTAHPIAPGFLGVGPIRSTTSPALEWLWKHLQDVASPCILDCGLVRRSTVGILLDRGAKLYMTDLISPLQQKRDYWDYSCNTPVFRTDRFLAELPPIPRCSLSAVLCWQLLDLLPPEVLAQVILRMYMYLQPHGVLFCILREPWLPASADWVWWLEGLTRLRREDGRGVPFRYAPITNREVDRLIPNGRAETFMTRSGLREVVAVK